MFGACDINVCIKLSQYLNMFNLKMPIHGVQPNREGLNMTTSVDGGTILGFRSSKYHILAKSLTENNLSYLEQNLTSSVGRHL